MQKTVALPAGERVPAFGIGTWCLGDKRSSRAEELATIRLGLDAGATLIDTAEMYGDGRSEELVGEAVAGRRDEVFLVSKVLPYNASRLGTVQACEASLRRLGTDRLDLYLLHWPGSEPLEDTVEAFLALQKAGKIRHWGVSNFDVAEMNELFSLDTGAGVQVNQVLYNLVRRGPEWALTGCLQARGIPLMAYSPIEQARLLRDRKLVGFARAHGMTPAQVALAWLLTKPDVIVIPRTARSDRMRENLGALDHSLTADQVAELDRLFAPPDKPSALEML